MSSFRALNVEPEDDSPEEVDDTYEVHLEDAFKLYQNALRFHSLGPGYLEQAKHEYEQLFRSEIFQYPEAASEYHRNELDVDAGPRPIVEESPHHFAVVAPADTQSSPSTLPQILHLSLKNYGQCLLELHAQHSPHLDLSSIKDLQKRALVVVCLIALQKFAEALESDDTDLDLWRKAARVSQICASDRILRFCLESVIAGDDGEPNGAAEILGLDEVTAVGQLKHVITLLCDDLSLTQNIRVEPRSDLLKLLNQRFEPLSFLPSTVDADLATKSNLRGTTSIHAKPNMLSVSSPTWFAVGQALLQACNDGQECRRDFASAAPVYLDIPMEMDTGLTEASPNGRNILKSNQVANETLIEVKDPKDGGLTSRAATPPMERQSLRSTEVAQENGETGLPSADADAAMSPSLIETSVAANERVGGSGRSELENRESSLPARKRTADSAGHDDPPDGGRLKSKRIRNRESNVDTALQEEENAINLARRCDDQLTDLAEADDLLFSAESSLLSHFGIVDLGSVRDLYQGFLLVSQGKRSQERNLGPEWTNLHDILSTFMSWSDEKTECAAHGLGGAFFNGGTASLAVALEQSTTLTPTLNHLPQHTSGDELIEFARRINEGWHTAQQVVLEWLEMLIRPTVEPGLEKNYSGVKSSSYLATLWPDDLKKAVLDLIVQQDDFIYQVMGHRLESMNERLLPGDRDTLTQSTLQDFALGEMAQTLYELHLEIYTNTMKPTIDTDTAICKLQLDRLHRWSNLACSFVNISVDHATHAPCYNRYVMRFIWAATLNVKVEGMASQEHVMLCLKDLRNLLDSASIPTIVLPNNAAMPEISITTLDQEISRISTLEFFTGILNVDSTDPVTVIECLEPVLEPHQNGWHSMSPTSTDREDRPTLPLAIAQSQQLAEFLESSDASLKLFLWRRLSDAYSAIDYPPKVVSCYLRSVEAIFANLSSERHKGLSFQTREDATLKWIKELDDIITKLLQVISIHDQAFEFVDKHHLETVTSIVSKLCRLFHGVILFEDHIRLGRLPEPKGKKPASTKSLDKFREKLKDIYVRTRVLQYMLLKESIAQNPAHVDDLTDASTHYLASLHRALGSRGYCRYSNKLLLRLLKTELMGGGKKQKHIAEIAQVIFDLHQLKIAPGLGDWDHHCPPEPLDKRSALPLLELIMSHLRNMPMKEFLKSELRNTVDKIQHTLGPPKSASVLSYNLRTINAYLKSPVHQLQLFCALRGQGDLPVRTVKAESVKIAQLGWYFLVGNLALNRFKLTKRTNPGPVDDLDTAMTFFKYDLEHGIEKWETWFRLGQAYDAKIEEDILWTAEKVNGHRTELATLQRSAIHSYERALALSLREVDDTVETANKISEMYRSFATRLYASSREPLSMDAFDNHRFRRHYSSSNEQATLYQAPAAPSMPAFSVWRFSAHLLRRALVQEPQNWFVHYMLGKCLWKMLMNPERESRRKVDVTEVLDEFTEAIECLPDRKDSKADHILEPHFKLVSAVHKLVHRKMMSPSQGAEALEATPWARKVHLAEEDDSWEPYVLEILKKIGHADKSNWHHRIIARAAHINYDDQQNIAGALGAKHEFTQQIFTKTMTVQVWKPEFERAGRHFVYTSRYVSFFVSLLGQLSDRASMDLLVKRIRRKPAEYLNHQRVWEQAVVKYAEILRRLAKAPAGHEEALFRSMDHEEFLTNSSRLEIHAHDPETSDPMLDVLRDAIELKKLNSSLMKGPLIDDLIVDCYASLYQSFVKAVPLQDGPEAARGMATDHEDTRPALDDAGRVRMELGTILSSQRDGAVESPKPPAVAPPAGASGPVQKSTRPKVVTRREAQRKAEGLVLRPPPIRTPTLTKSTCFPPASSTNVADVSAKTAGKQSESRSIAANTPPSPAPAPPSSSPPSPLPPVMAESGPPEGSRIASPADNDAPDAEEMTRNTASSQVGSVHDSADDESELSELEDSGHGLEDDTPNEGQQIGPQIATAARVGVGDEERSSGSDSTSSSSSSSSSVATNRSPERADTETDSGPDIS